MISSLSRFKHRLSIRGRLVLSIFTASSIVMLVIAAMLVYLSTRTIEQQAEAGLATTIEVLSQDFVKILLLDAPDVAADTVSKLEAFHDVQAVFLYDREGAYRFGYRKVGVPELAVPPYQVADVSYHEDYLEVFSPLEYQGQQFGVVYVRLSLDGFRQRMQDYYRLILVLFPVLLLFTLIVALRFQRSFSEPVRQLAQAFDQVSASSRYDFRVETPEQNEIGQLFRGFNRMLERIEAASEELEEARQRLHVTLESIGDAVVSCDSKCRVLYLNRSAERLLQWSRADAAGRPIEEIAHTVHETSLQELAPCQLALYEAREIPPEPNVLLVNKSGERVPVSVSASPMWDSAGSVVGAVMVIRDVTEARRLNRELSYQASHDSLTGLINRSEFEKILERELNNARALDGQFVLLYLDLDQFKVVNDTCGHIAGDQLLKQLATILQAELRSSDVLARLGGDEFAVLLVGCDVDTARSIAETLRRTVTDFRFVWENKSFTVGLSIGMVQVNGDSESGIDLLSAADVACYAAKDAGRNRIQLFQKDDSVTQRRYSEVQWVSRIVRGLDEERFRLFRQNIVDVEGGAGDGEHFEVLIRLLDEEGRLVPPGAFFPAAERFGVTPGIDRWVLRSTLELLAADAGRLSSLRLCSINISGHTLVDERFLDFVEAQLDASVVPADRLCFEITETAAIADLATARQFIARLKQRGCRFALDDFGSGLSSFAYLKNLDVDFLKIDGMFVRDMASDPIDRAMVKSINEIGHVMGMKTIAEFVESDAIREQLKAIGVDFAQGYGIHKPEPMQPVSATVSKLA